ncbi:cell division control protein 45 homolog [Oscarella lobularis]|uniref:cell division control protein 45 homolog n=1 Tax=Oscarella lobularis TaxID=121494 RepID=UPI003313D2AB
MFIENFRDGFYAKILHQRLLILVALDADALCACKILQALLHADNVPYTLVPVDGVASLQRAFQEHGEQVNYVVMINCGGNIDILDVLQPEENVIFYVIDSHRPLFLDNIFNDGQVKLIVNSQTETFQLPEFDDIYGSEVESDEEDDEADDDDDDDEGVGEENKLDDGSDGEGTEPARKQPKKESRYRKRRRKRIWKQKREEIKHKYYYYAYKGTSSAMLVFDLAWKMSKDNSDLLWYAIVGLADQKVHGCIDGEKYVTDTASMQDHVLRFAKSETASGALTSRKITFENDLRLTLYRHWSLYESLYNSEYTACRFRVWTVKGQKKLQEFLADIGISLSQCKQRFNCMDMETKANVLEWIETLSSKYGLDDISRSSFCTQFGFCNKTCAEDMALCLTSLLHSKEDGHSPTDDFHTALDALSRTNASLMNDGLLLAQKHQEAIMLQVKSFIDMRQPMNAGQFIYAHVDVSMPHAKYFSQSSRLTSLARFLMNAWNLTTKRARDLPFVVSAPYNAEEGTCLIVGIPSIIEEQHKSFLGRAFEHAVARSRVRANRDSFDASVIELKMDDRMEFCDALSHILSA